MQDGLTGNPNDISTQFKSGMGIDPSSMEVVGQFNPQQLQEDAVAKMINMRVTQSIQNPGIEAMRPEDYYPGINRSINVGSFSGPLGSVPQYAAGMPHTPYGVLDAKNLARQKIQAEYEQDMLKNMTYDYLQTADKVKQGALNRQTDFTMKQIYEPFVKKHGAIAGYKIAKNSQEFKRAMAALNLRRDQFDELFADDVSTVLQFKNQQIGGAGKTTTTKEVGDEKGESVTTKETLGMGNGAGRGQEPGYVSGPTAANAIKNLNSYVRDDLSIEEMENINQNAKTRHIITKSLDQTVEQIGHDLVADVQTFLMNEAGAGKLTYGKDIDGNVVPMIDGKLSTDKNAVNVLMTKSGITKERIHELALRTRENLLARVGSVYGDKRAEEGIWSLKEIEDELSRFVQSKTTLVAQEVGKSGVEEQMKARKIKQELNQPIKSQKQESTFFPGKEETVWTIPQPTMSKSFFLFNAATGGTKINPYTKATEKTTVTTDRPYTVSEVADVDGGLYATVYPVKVQQATDAAGKPMFDPQTGDPLTENIIDYMNGVRVPYNTVKSNLESNPALQEGFEVGGKIKKGFESTPYTEFVGGATKKPAAGGINLNKYGGIKRQ